MENKKNYLLGIATGVVLVILLNSVTTIYNVHAKGVSNYTRKVEALYGIIDEHYVNDYDKEELLEHMYAGLLSGLGDPYTSYLDESALADFYEDVSGVYAGIGVVILHDRERNKIVVGGVFSNSPGEKVGIQAGDEIIKVSNIEVDGSDFQLVPKLTKGKPGTKVTVSVFRPADGEIHDFELTRETIELDTVLHRMIDGEIGYIRISQFDDVTYNQFVEAYTDLSQQGMKGLILDLRNNPGGLMNSVVKITDMLVPEGYITYTEYKDGTREYHHSDKNQIEIPLTILVNGNSASASEVLSGAVQDYGVGTLVGTQTYGKGVVQTIYGLSDGSGVKITIAKYYTPNGICIDGMGITPDYIVEMSEEDVYNISFLELKEDDHQLLKAIAVIQSQIE